MSQARVLIVSNRLPITLKPSAEGTRFVTSAGGLANGLASWHEDGAGLWIGHPGDAAQLDDAKWRSIQDRLAARRLVPVQLSDPRINRSYDRFCNEIIWPWLHGLLGYLPLELNGWADYEAVNRAFVEAVVAVYRQGDLIWVHDYHLMLVPTLVRERLPDARIGFFLHVPVPAPELWHTLPWSESLSRGLLGADVIGVHTTTHLRNLLGTMRWADANAVHLDEIDVEHRRVRIGVFPMGVDVSKFEALARSSAVRARREEIRREAGGRPIVLGVDRLDYTKGVVRRLRAVESVLSSHTFKFIQIAVPSGHDIESHRRLRRQVNHEVGRINTSHGEAGWQPVTCLQRHFPHSELVAFYMAADVMLVTPLRDGMNLVAKEFVASRVDEDGVLVLSKFAGAAEGLDGARLVNPYDIDEVASNVRAALAVPPDARAVAMRRLRQTVVQQDVYRWAASFLKDLASVGLVAAGDWANLDQPDPDQPWVELVRRAEPIRLLLDYDGTLVTHTMRPADATPDATLLELLNALCAAPGIRVEIVSGRSRTELQRWFGSLPVTLWAEHGLWRREPAKPWTGGRSFRTGWHLPVTRLMNRLVDTVPGSFIEFKDYGIAWHHRPASVAPEEWRLREAAITLDELTRQQGLEVLKGDGVLEVRSAHSTKASAVEPDDQIAGEVIVAIGNDRTDEDMFRALPPSAISVVVGTKPSCARFRVSDVNAVRRLLGRLGARNEARVDSTATARYG
jgi:trehalose 6-phosphate synthase/phosphatase